MAVMSTYSPMKNRQYDELLREIIDKRFVGKHADMTAISHDADYSAGYIQRTVRFDVTDKAGEHLEYRNLPVNQALDLLLAKQKMKELQIIIPIKPVPKMYKKGRGGHLYRHPATANYERYVNIYAKRAINQYRWRSTKCLRLEFWFYFATKKRALWGMRKVTKPDSTNLQKSTEDALSPLIGDDMKVADIESKKRWAKEDRVVIKLINVPEKTGG